MTFDAQRRGFLKGLAAVAASCAVPGRLFAAGAGPTALVIGSGIAGLSAAWKLVKAGFQVSIFEKEKFTGGRMVELQMGPLFQFTHAQAVADFSRQMLDLAAEVGVENELRGEGFGMGDLTNVPSLRLGTLMRTPLLLPDMIEILQSVDPCLIETGVEFDDESLGDYYERKLGREAGREFVRYVIEPACSAWGWPPYETTKIALLPWLDPRANFMQPRGGIGVLTRKLGSLLPVQNDTTVRTISPPDSRGRHTVHYLDANLERRQVTPDVVVCAVEGKYLDRMVQGMTPKQDALAKNVYFSKEAIVCYILDDEHAPKEEVRLVYYPDHPDPIKAMTTSLEAFPRDPERGHPPHVRFCLSRRHTPEWQKSDTALEDFCWPMVKQLYPQIERSHVVDIVDYTCDDLCYMPVGYVTRVADVLKEQRTQRRGLYFAGEYVAGAHTGAACASGLSVATEIVKHWA